MKKNKLKANNFQKKLIKYPSNVWVFGQKTISLSEIRQLLINKKIRNKYDSYLLIKDNNNNNKEKYISVLGPSNVWYGMVWVFESFKGGVSCW